VVVQAIRVDAKMSMRMRVSTRESECRFRSVCPHVKGGLSDEHLCREWQVASLDKKVKSVTQSGRSLIFSVGQLDIGRAFIVREVDFEHERQLEKSSWNTHYTLTLARNVHTCTNSTNQAPGAQHEVVRRQMTCAVGSR